MQITTLMNVSYDDDDDIIDTKCFLAALIFYLVAAIQGWGNVENNAPGQDLENITKTYHQCFKNAVQHEEAEKK